MSRRLATPAQPVQTRFGGILYRSRLEARWAAFFTKIGLEFTYEPEGYDLGGSWGWYLPDFSIDTWGIFAEIKPFEPTPGEIQKCRLLARLSKRNVLLLSGQPVAPRGQLFGHDPELDYVDWAALAICRRCPAVVCCVGARSDGDASHWQLDFGCCQSNNRERDCGERQPEPWYGLEQAALWAQNQKFGERGA